MTTSDSIFGPELEGLLQEAARDPKSCLLRVPRPPVVLTPFDRIRRVSITTAGLSALDRHLLEVHRHELAFRLRELCYLLFHSQPRYALSFSPSIRDVHSTTDEDLDRWRRDAEIAVAAEQPASSSRVGAELACVIRESDLSRVDVGRLARMSSRLVPTAQARVYEAFEYYSRGRLGRSLRILGDLARSRVSAIVRASTLQGIVSVHVRQGRYWEARRWSDESVRMQRGNENAHFNQLLVGLGCNESSRAGKAVHDLDTLFRGYESAATPFFERAGQQIAEGLLRLPPEGVTLLRGLRDEVDLPVGAILDAAACQV